MSKQLPTLYQEIICKSRYSRYLDKENRRESWPETVGRYINFMYKQAKKQNISEEDLHSLYLLLGATCDE